MFKWSVKSEAGSEDSWDLTLAEPQLLGHKKGVRDDTAIILWDL